MKSSKAMKKVCFVSLLILTLNSMMVFDGRAESNEAFNDEADIAYSNPNWMNFIRDEIFISDLSVPGTHDTIASNIGMGGIGDCQSLSLEKQLNAGIRAVDIRCRHIENMFTIHHGPIFLNATFQDVLAACRNFLKQNNSETILMRIQEEHEAENCTRSFESTFLDETSNYTDLIYNIEKFEGIFPTLGEVRGKIVILQGFPSGLRIYGIPWNYLNIQDEYTVYATHDSMNNKWRLIQEHINKANTEYITAQEMNRRTNMYINFTSAVGPAAVAPLPFEVASGFTMGTYIDGMNARLLGNLAPLVHPLSIRRCGIIMMDFPGKGLIDTIIRVNYWPHADAGGPYTARIGEMVTLDASNSSDLKNPINRYDWDLNNDGRYDEGGIRINFTRPEYGLYTVVLGVRNAAGTIDTDRTTVLFSNIVADAGGPYSMIQGETITLDASDSHDLDNPGDIAGYKFEWDFNNDGRYDDANGVTVSFTSSQPGEHTVGLRVSRRAGVFGMDTTPVAVMDNPPIIQTPTPTPTPITWPANPSDGVAQPDIVFEFGGSSLQDCHFAEIPGGFDNMTPGHTSIGTQFDNNLFISSIDNVGLEISVNLNEVTFLACLKGIATNNQYALIRGYVRSNGPGAQIVVGALKGSIFTGKNVDGTLGYSLMKTSQAYINNEGTVEALFRPDSGGIINPFIQVSGSGLINTKVWIDRLEIFLLQAGDIFP